MTVSSLAISSTMSYIPTRNITKPFPSSLYRRPSKANSQDPSTMSNSSTPHSIPAASPRSICKDEQTRSNWSKRNVNSRSHFCTNRASADESYHLFWGHSLANHIEPYPQPLQPLDTSAKLDVGPKVLKLSSEEGNSYYWECGSCRAEFCGPCFEGTEKAGWHYTPDGAKALVTREIDTSSSAGGEKFDGGLITDEVLDSEDWPLNIPGFPKDEAVPSSTVEEAGRNLSTVKST
ncbi:hypothetical protein BJ508DRAFT_325117 [Ascobolus immersus RN42]|uniref:Uncharacterized protein n=1 Tax=Ascobolus immersus RN42 TaxID=1160509 RepID=A0A3N4IFP6_ASCIM|nr:hypothetical protein BJ508DRAFT_325117 [Ascobolus immersus RN42]